jgi:GNAT superfamily N-acetyltransferase
MSEPRTEVLHGAELRSWLPALARLRMEVFREYPYLYDGDADYERSYLETYARSSRSLLVAVLIEDDLVGASTAVPLADETEALQAPYRRAGYNPDQLFYFGESVVRGAYRGRGWGSRFFYERLRHAQGFGTYSTATFCSVVRAPEDPRRPAGYRGPEELWRRQGFSPVDGLRVEMSWREIGTRGETAHALQAWIRSIE